MVKSKRRTFFPQLVMRDYPFQRSAPWLFASLATISLLQAKEDEKPEVTPGEIQRRTYFFKEADKKMPYSLYVPEGYDKKKKYLYSEIKIGHIQRYLKSLP